MNKKTGYKWEKFGLLTFGFILIIGLASATITIDSTNGITSTNGIDINTIRHVAPNSASSLKTKIELGGSIVIPCGTYSVSDYITMVSNTHIKGSGDCTIISHQDGTSGLTSTEGTGNITVENLRIEGNGNTAQAIRLSGTGNSNHGNIIISNIHATNIQGTAILYNGTYLEATNNKLENVLNGVGIQRHDSTEETLYYLVTENYITTTYNSSSPTEYGEGVECNVHDSEKSTCKITNNYIQGFREESIDANAHHNIITGNTIKLTSDSRGTNGITCGAYVGGTCIISNNKIYNLSLTSDDAIDNNQYTNFFIISNNYLSSTNQLGTGIEIDDSSIFNGGIISNNIFNNLEIGIDNNLGSSKNVEFIANQFNNTADNIQNSNSITAKISIEDLTFWGNGTFGKNDVNTDYNFYIGSAGEFRISRNTAEYLKFLTDSGSVDITSYAKTFDLGTGDAQDLRLITDGSVAVTIDTAGNLTIPELAGTGNDYACLDSNGKLYRSASACS